MLNLGGESQRSLHLPEMWALHPRGKGYQGGKWGGPGGSLHPPLRKRKKLATFRGGQSIRSSGTGQEKDRD